MVDTMTLPELMTIKEPQLIAARATRGIGPGLMLGLVTDYTILVPLALARTEVTPGRETAVAVAIPPLPPNADIERATATLYVADATGAPGQITTGVSITRTAGSGDDPSGSYSVAVDQPVRPSGAQLKLEGGAPFWAAGGVLSEPSYELPDFAEALNAFLDGYGKAEPLTSLPFVISSASRGRVGLSVAIVYSLVRTEDWQNELDGTTRVDRSLELAFGAVERLELRPLAGRAGQAVSLRRLSLDLGGQLGPERLLGPVEDHDGREHATVSADYAVAQRFTLSARLLPQGPRCSGITGLFTPYDPDAPEPAELYLELQPDAGGSPAAGAPLAHAALTLAPARGPAPGGWSYAAFAEPVALAAGQAYWMVVKGVRGRCRLALLAPPADAGDRPLLRGPLAINRGGQVWKALGRAAAPAALLSLVYLPAEDNQTAALQLVVSGAPQTAAPLVLPIDVGPEARTVSVPLSGVYAGADWNQARLEIRSSARGTLNIANIIRQYRLV